MAAALTDLGNGSYEGSYTLQHAGEYRLHVRFGGAPISASPFAVRVEPARRVEQPRVDVGCASVA